MIRVTQTSLRPESVGNMPRGKKPKKPKQIFIESVFLALNKTKCLVPTSNGLKLGVKVHEVIPEKKIVLLQVNRDISNEESYVLPEKDQLKREIIAEIDHRHQLEKQKTEDADAAAVASAATAAVQFDLVLDSEFQKGMLLPYVFFLQIFF